MHKSLSNDRLGKLTEMLMNSKKKLSSHSQTLLFQFRSLLARPQSLERVSKQSEKSDQLNRRPSFAPDPHTQHTRPKRRLNIKILNIHVVV